MTDPPMQWGYPRTVEGFFHALSRGQYETVSGYNIFAHPGHFLFQLGYIGQGLSESFNWVYMFIGLLPFVYLLKMHKRERYWIIGLTAIYVCLSVLLVVLINVSPDRASTDLNKVFFTASHGLFAMMIGYGLTLLAAYTATNYEKIRRWGLLVGAVAVILAVYSLLDAAAQLYGGPAGEISLSDLPHHIALAFNKDQYGLPIFANLILLGLPLGLIAAFLVYRQRGPVLIMLCLFGAMPLWSGLSHWYKSEQHNHWFGFWFGHDMFTPPFTDPKTGQLSYDNDLRATLLKNPTNSVVIYPEMDRNTILYGGTDPGRFCPTYSIFCDSFIPHSCQPKQDQKFDRRDCYLITQNALADGTYLEYLRAQYNRSKQIDPPFFSRLFRYVAALLHVGTPDAVPLDGPDIGGGNSGNSLVEGICSLLDHTLDRGFAAWGAYVEKYRRARGVYPPSEIYIASPEDQQGCFGNYLQDLERRAQLGQLRPGENPPDSSGRISISGQYEIMYVNGLICKVIFDRNPTNSFYVEESMPIEWMYPHETPFGIIMKINRDTLPELPGDVFKLDHEFWTKYSARLCGNWITYDTTVQQLADFVDRTYVHNNYQGYQGDHAFVRDDDAQKAFSKLRSSQAGMYAWRCALPGTPTPCPPEYRQKTPASQTALLREAEFAYKQAFAFCPYSSEAVFGYANLLLGMAQTEEMSGQLDQAVHHFDDAILLGETCEKLDPYNGTVTNLVGVVKGYRAQIMQHAGEFKQTATQVAAMEATARANPANVQNLVALGNVYLQMQQPERAREVFDQALGRPEITFSTAQALAQAFAQLQDLGQLDKVLKKMVSLAPDQPETHYDLASLEAITGRSQEALAELKLALDLSNRRLAKNPAARNLATMVRSDPRFTPLTNSPEFQRLIAPK
jgi:tetratricopeptide (TPR) repeat protein